MNHEDIRHALEAELRRREERFRDHLRAACRIDILTEYDQRMKNVRLGITHAHMLWHSLSGAQRRALLMISQYHGKAIKGGNYYLCGVKGKFCGKERIATIRKLAAHELLDWNGGAFDPEAEAALNEHGRFLLQYGPAHSCQTCRK